MNEFTSELTHSVEKKWKPTPQIDSYTHNMKKQS